MTVPINTCSGFCCRCETTHHLPAEIVRNAALDLIERLDRERRLDLHLPVHQADPRYTTKYLFGPARGKMFGIMVCRGNDGRKMTLKAFSGQYNGQWELEGWMPPLFDPSLWNRVNRGPEAHIKRLGREIVTVGPATPTGKALIEERKQCSQELMKTLHRLYRLHNFRRQRRSLAEAFNGANGIPNGTADCCAPKLLNFAARNNLHPIGLAEFYYGRPNKRGTRRHGEFYTPCKEKCGPILGFMLCGLERPIAMEEDLE